MIRYTFQSLITLGAHWFARMFVEKKRFQNFLKRLHVNIRLILQTYFERDAEIDCGDLISFSWSPNLQWRQ